MFEDDVIQLLQMLRTRKYDNLHLWEVKEFYMVGKRVLLLEN